MKTADRTFGWLLVVASLLHTYGSFMSYENAPITLVWALSGSLAGLLVAAVNLLRTDRPSDYSLAWVSFAGSLGWTAVAFSIGKVTGHVFDFRPLTHMILGTALAAMSIRTLVTAHRADLREGKVAGPI
jgi:phage tail tape-measure protein